MVVLKRILALFLSVIAIFSVAVIPLSAVDSTTIVTKMIDKTTAYEDLSGAKENGVPISVALKYPRNKARGDGYAELIGFVEAGYKQDVPDSKQTDYALYCYVYYPYGTYPIVGSTLHQIHLVTAFNKKDVNGNNITDPSEWTVAATGEFQMQLVNSENGATGYGTYPILKFKVDVKPGDLDNVAGNNRRYDVEGVEIHFRGASGTKNFTFASSFVCSGYRKGCGNNAKEDTFSMTTSQVSVEQIEVMQTHYRLQNKEDVHQQTQINSVYFAIDNDFAEKHGDITAITAEWFESQTTPIVVTSDEAFYDEMNGDNIHGIKYVGLDLTALSESCLPERTLGMYGKASVTENIFAWRYNSFGRNSGLCINVVDESPLMGDCNRLSWLLKYPADAGSAGVPWQQSLAGAYVPTKRLHEYYEQHLKENGYIVGDSYEYADLVSAGLINGKADADRVYGQQSATFGGSLEFVEGFKYSNGFTKFWQQLFNGVRDEQDIDVQAITKVDASDFGSLPLDDEALSKKYLISAEEVAKFSEKCREAFANDQTVIIFRFAVTDYFSAPLCITADAPLNTTRYFNGLAYVAQETMFFGFDVLEFHVNKGGVTTVIPVGMQEIDHMSGLTASPDMPDRDPFSGIGNTINDWLSKIKTAFLIFMGVLALVVVVIVVLNLIGPVATVAGAVGKGAGSAAKGISRALTSKKKRKRK